MGASFSGQAKAEICRLVPAKKSQAAAQCYGVLLFANCFSPDRIRIVTESPEFAELLPKLFQKAFHISFDLLPASPGGKQVFQILNTQKLAAILAAFGLETGSFLPLQLNLPVVEEDSCKAAFLRGAFLAGGSVTDPAKAYHIELATTHVAVARQTYALLEDALGFYPKMAERGGARVLYMKQSEKISDFLTYLGAPLAGMGIMEAKIEKELNNKVNRRCNCDEANTSKVVDAAQEQLAAIRVLRGRGLVDTLPAKLRQAAAAREENPEATLSELAALMDPPISKPAMNHRLRRIAELAKEVSA